MADKKMKELLEWRENVPAGRLLNPGLPPFDLLNASEWSVLDEAPGRLELMCDLPEVTLNPAGQLFGGFTAAYVDIGSLYAAQSDVEGTPGFQSTINMRVDYFEPIREGIFNVEGRVLNRRGKNRLISVQIRQSETTAVYSLVTLRDTGE